MRNENRLLVLTILTVLSCTGALWFGTRSRSIAARFPPAPEPAAPFRATAVVHAEDCDSRLAFLHTFSRPEFRGRIHVDLLVIGTAGEVTAVTRRVRSRGITVPIRQRRTDPGSARLLGYLSTPYVLVFGEEGRVRIAETIPATPAELAGFERRIRSLLAHAE
jgi:hypothetical protein